MVNWSLGNLVCTVLAAFAMLIWLALFSSSCCSKSCLIFNCSRSVVVVPHQLMSSWLLCFSAFCFWLLDGSLAAISPERRFQYRFHPLALQRCGSILPCLWFPAFFVSIPHRLPVGGATYVKNASSTAANTI